MVLQMAEWAIDIDDINLVKERIEHDAARETLSDHFKSDHQIGNNPCIPTIADPSADTPRKKFGVMLDIGDKIEHLLWRIRQDPALCVRVHIIAIG